MKGMKYLIQLSNGETRIVTILDKVRFKVIHRLNASPSYLTDGEIQAAGDNLTHVDRETPYHLYEYSSGYIIDEGAMFKQFQMLRKPIVKIEKLDAPEATIEMGKRLNSLIQAAWESLGFNEEKMKHFLETHMRVPA